MSETFEIIMRENGFRRHDDVWTRQNLTSYGLLDLTIKQLGIGRWDCTVWEGKRVRAAAEFDSAHMLALVREFLTS
jgi:hypothetical protein